MSDYDAERVMYKKEKKAEGKSNMRPPCGNGASFISISKPERIWNIWGGWDGVGGNPQPKTVI